MVDGPTAACWDPHRPRVLASSDSVHLRTWDVRVGGGSGSGSGSAGAPTLSIEHAHEDQILDVDFNPNKPYHLLSTGRDRRIHVWDLRRCGPQAGPLSSISVAGGSGAAAASGATAAAAAATTATPPTPLKTMLHHSHWVWQAKFNRFHDQLILSAGTELVNLWNMGSVSSAPVGELEHTNASTTTSVPTQHNTSHRISAQLTLVNAAGAISKQRSTPTITRSDMQTDGLDRLRCPNDFLFTDHRCFWFARCDVCVVVPAPLPPLPTL